MAHSTAQGPSANNPSSRCLRQHSEASWLADFDSGRLTSRCARSGVVNRGCGGRACGPGGSCGALLCHERQPALGSPAGVLYSRRTGVLLNAASLPRLTSREPRGVTSRAKSGEAVRARFQAQLLNQPASSPPSPCPRESRLAAQPLNKGSRHGWTLRTCFLVAAFSGRRRAFLLVGERVGGKTFSLPPKCELFTDSLRLPCFEPGISADFWAKRAGRGVSRHGPAGFAH